MADDDICSVSLPVNIPCTGRYVIVRPAGSYGRFPNPEDHIVLARRIGGEFAAVFSTYVPFDEGSLVLWDCVEQTDHLVAYHSYYLAYSTDGGATFHHLSRETQKAIGYDRWSETKIITATIEGNKIVLEIATFDPFDRSSLSSVLNRKVTLAMWHVPLGAEATPIRVPSQSQRLAVSDFKAMYQDTRIQRNHLLLVFNGRLLARASVAEGFERVPVGSILRHLADTATVEFFGGSGARTIGP